MSDQAPTFPPQPEDWTPDTSVPSPTSVQPPRTPELEALFTAVQRIKEQLHQLVVGQQEFVELLIAALFSGGHALVEGPPGLAKTLTSKLLAATLGVSYNRIQFTPDLMPSDVIGTTVFNMKSSDFSFHAGPVFAHILLIDEINRAPAKTQAALFEVMEENQVTVDGTTYELEQPFFVMATQNPIEQEGTYRLPEAQLDRFLLKIILDYPSLDDERQILRQFRQDFRRDHTYTPEVILTATEVLRCRRAVEQVHIQDELLDYIAAIVYDTRQHADLYLGASPRASLAILKMSKAYAAIQGRNFVTPDDIQYVAYPVLNHRILLTPEREMEGSSTSEVIRDIVHKIEVPR